jgi:hypothetical protein
MMDRGMNTLAARGLEELFFQLCGCVSFLELYPNLVFWYGMGWYFLGIFLTDTKGKLGKDLRYRTFGGNPFFARFCPLFDGPSPPFEESSRKISQNGAPAKSYSTKNIVHTIPNIPTGKCR